ncbi:MAG: TRAP transporter substrate-binding protein [Roseibium album]|uniref:Neu5Ac-binding protein n=2 Tax=cellular organisms TaxID=131567 RepID=A0A0M7AIR6_9HYPH|nr:TRAP transporter substrate-binding protein [Roseibium album]MBG6158581.1 tripartite ATP-independent transporter DctP family solute receptor [Labrenzia sp. EL_162]MBG6160365.1 tripartite ATP-independent transporter DctP family solute receptor [Labrenzia sp. EL_195]MBG6178699.1 tripartite ATP-independent transporter DctP family solute receptor [Labrenzia sp. EL_132]MBG6197115.1 tripartite ATP-independent transporter DctP family solute receptor [Labrenzia sp. EL_159]MBG6203943.1 tripartite ATP
MLDKKTLSRLLMSAAIVVASAGSAAAAETLRFSHTDNPGGSRQAAAELFAEKVAEYTDGRYEVQIFPSGQLANDPKAIELLQLGGIDFTVSATGSYATHLPTLNLTAMPFLVDTYEQGWELYDNSDWLQGEFDKLPEKGFRVLSTWEAGFRSFTTNEPLASPEDAQSMKMRVFPNDMIRWSMEAIGFQTVVMPITDVYLSIQQGIVNGQENPVDTINSLRFYEVAPNITLTRHVYSPLPLTIAEKTWQSFSDEDKEAVRKAAAESAAFSRNLVKSSVDSQLSQMTEDGAKVSVPEIGPFREAVQPVYAKAKDVYGEEAVNNILSDAAAIRDALPAQN